MFLHMCTNRKQFSKMENDMKKKQMQGYTGVSIETMGMTDDAAIAAVIGGNKPRESIHTSGADYVLAFTDG